MPTDPPLSQKRILVADDQNTMREIIKALLKALGIQEVTLVEDGQEAWAKLQGRIRYDLIICDWNMPKMSGLELVQAMRKVPALNSTRFLMVTASADPNSVREAVHAGINGYVVKPFQPAVLADKVMQMLK